MTSLSEQIDNDINRTKNGAAPGKVCVNGQGTPGRHLATAPGRLKIGTGKV